MRSSKQTLFSYTPCKALQEFQQFFQSRRPRCLLSEAWGTSFEELLAAIAPGEKGSTEPAAAPVAGARREGLGGRPATCLGRRL